MFGIETLDEVPRKLAEVYSMRLQSHKLPAGTETLRGPIGLFLIREDGASGSKLAEEVVGSFKYWDYRSGHFFDGVFLGWGFDGGPAFMDQAFCRCVEALESKLNWRYRGGAHLFLTDFVYDANTKQGELDFSQIISLDVSALLDEKKLTQLSPLIEELIAPVRNQRSHDSETSVWEISDYIGLLRARRVLWQTLIKKIGSLLGLIDAVAPYRVRDLRRQS